MCYQVGVSLENVCYQVGVSLENVGQLSGFKSGCRGSHLKSENE